jgi:uncharacterized protein
MNIADLRATARTYFDDGPSPAHDWHHVQRVEALADRLLTDCDAEERTVRTAVLLHDIGRAREDRGEITDHAAWGAREARRLLSDRDVDDDRIENVAHAIAVHRYSNDREPETTEAKVLCDADNLDALGAVGIARCFTYGGERGEEIFDPAVPPAEDDSAAGLTQYNHVHKKILDLPERMYTDAGRAIATERRAFVADFLDRFDREVAGDA